MSSRSAPVIKVKLEPHTNADSLSLVRVDNFGVCVRTSDWNDGDLGCYIPPDSIVNGDRSEFSFLGAGPQRIKTKKLRGVWSMGLLIPVPFAQEGDDLYDYLEIQHYEPELSVASMNTDNEKAPNSPFGHLSKYDVENGRGKYSRLFQEGESVWVTEKLNGFNLSVFHDGERFWVKSRNFWKKEEEDCLFWQAVKSSPEIVKFCQENPNLLVRGEGYGKVGGFPYDRNGKVGFRVFDIMKPDLSYFNSHELLSICKANYLPMVPSLGFHEFDIPKLLTLSEGKTTLGKHIREGVVVRPILERVDPRFGRAIIKFVSNEYLEKN